MTQTAFIFSNERSYRFKRHLLFWTTWLVFMGFLYAFTPVLTDLTYIERLPASLCDAVLYLPVHILLSYSLMYFVIPRYIVKSRYLLATLWILIVIAATAFLSAIISLYVISPVKEALLPSHLIVRYGSSASFKRGAFYLALLAGLRGGLSVGGIAAAIKLMKHWYTEGQRNLTLQKENAESQLQILKAQVHPHFLFNTLNNIYSYTQNTSSTASAMVMGLSDILRYMLYECNRPLVPLAKELKMTEEYIGLEKIRYGNALEMHIDLPKNTEGLYIAPLMLLPFIENCFKHGISNILDQPWLNLHITIDDRIMTMKVLNSKPTNRGSDHQPGIGIENVRKRLALLYPDKHELLINEEEEVFIVILKLELELVKARSHIQTQTRTEAVNNQLNLYVN
jgi:sensor histidine kinase YesM